MVNSVHVPQVVKVSLKSVRNEGHFTLEVGRVSRPYLPYDCSGVTQYYNTVLPAHALQTVQVRLKSVSIEGLLTLEGEKVFRPYLSYDCSAFTQ
jgi:hypothetical protein